MYARGGGGTHSPMHIYMIGAFAAMCGRTIVRKSFENYGSYFSLIMYESKGGNCREAP